jgi:hypothetical protein
MVCPLTAAPLCNSLEITIKSIINLYFRVDAIVILHRAKE